MIKVLFVCLGNICRSPLGEGIFRHLVAQAGLSSEFLIDSAGTGNWHVGAEPHHGSQRVATDRGIDLSGQRARQVGVEDLSTFDYVIAMDSQNLADLERLASWGTSTARLVRMMEFAPERGYVDVPDPYTGGPEGFVLVYELIEDAARGLLDHVLAERKLASS